MTQLAGNCFSTRVVIILNDKWKLVRGKRKENAKKKKKRKIIMRKIDWRAAKTN